MSKQEFNEYHHKYSKTVEDSIRFSGLEHSFFHLSKAHKLKELVSLNFGVTNRPNLLDVGCGVGALHPYIESTFEKIIGIDVSSASIIEAAKNHPQHSYLHYDGQRLPFDDNTFDMTLAVCVMHHVPKELWENFLAEKSRVTRPGGVVCLIEHNPVNPATRLSVARCPFDADAVLLGARQMRQRLKFASLDSVFSEHFVFFPTNNAPFRALERKLKWLPLGAQYLAVGKKK
ncbi:class I SAM-dependent methyltransferase [Yoonia maritima]|uniref:class I SAM-dependent methyltransferase n=1 Tax=Yoonia maritima TaxID=1435347 RepID=UPI000D0F862E|nr:class I SAM-dependent methyltransferase [Yoonia maritima]